MDNEKNNTRHNPQEKGSEKAAGSSFFDSLLNDIQKADNRMKGYDEKAGASRRSGHSSHPSGGHSEAAKATEHEASAASASAEQREAQTAAAKAAEEKAKAEEAARLAAERERAEAAAKAAAEKAKAEEAARIAAEREQVRQAAAKAAEEKAKAEEEARIAAERKQAEEAAAIAAEEKAKAEEAARLAAEQEQARQAAAKAAEEKAKAEEAARLAAERERAEAATAKAAEEKAKAEEAARIAAEQEQARQAAAKAAEEKAKAEEAARIAADEKARAKKAEQLAALERAKGKAPVSAEEKLKAAEAARLADKKAGVEDAARAAAELAKSEEAARQAAIEKAQKQAKARLAEIEAEKKAARIAADEEKARRAAVEKAKAEEAARLAALEKARAEEAARLAALEEAARKAEEEEPAYAALNFTDPAAAASAATAMKLAGIGEETEVPEPAIIDAEFEQSSYRSLTGEEEARQTAEQAEAKRRAAKNDADKQAKAEEAERKAAIEKAQAKEAERVAALEKAKAEDAKRPASSEKPSVEQKPSQNAGTAGQTGKTAAKAAAGTAATVSSGKTSGAAKTGGSDFAGGSAAKRPSAPAKPSGSGSGETSAAADAVNAKKSESAEPKKRKKIKADKPKGSRSPGKIISIVHLVLSVLTVLLLLFANVLPIPVLLIAIVGLVGIWFLTRMFRTDHAGRFRRLVGGAISVFMCAVLLLSSVMLLRLNVTLRSITGINSQIATYGVYALVDDAAENIKDVKDDPFGTLETQARAMTDDAIGQINKEVGKSIETKNYADGSALANALMQGECRTIIMNENFMDVITETDGYGDFEKKTKEIASYTCTSILDSILGKNHSSDVITMYFTGIDTFGDVSTTSRSDVNIIAVANTKTKQVVLVSTPRDYYVPLSISNGIPDKLTHAGIYGVNVSMDTLAMLYGIDMDYYFRINFDGFKEVIDALGGVDVWSDYEFDAQDHHFVQGYNSLNGEQALAFARARHAFASGDRQRGKNQMAVIEAVIKKLQTPAILNNYNELLKGLEGSFETSIPYTRIAGLVKQQLAKPGSWNVVQYSVDGTGDMNTTYSMNQQLYVMIPDQSTVDTAKRLIEMVDSGAVIKEQ